MGKWQSHPLQVRTAHRKRDMGRRTAMGQTEKNSVRANVFLRADIAQYRPACFKANRVFSPSPVSG